MINLSEIDPNLTGTKPVINYDDSSLKSEGFKLRCELNPKNPTYNKLLRMCSSQSIPYKTIPVEDNKEHIWIKE